MNLPLTPSGRGSRYRRAAAAIDAPAFRCLAGAVAAAAGGPAFAGIGDVEPAALEALLHRHRLSAPVHDLIATACAGREPVRAARLAATAQRKRLGALQLVRHVVAISRAFDAAGIRHLAIKGPALARQLFGDPAARDSKDLDFLVDPTRLDDAVVVLGALGFATGRVDDGHDVADGKHVTLRGHAIEVEVHSRLIDIPALLPLGFDELWAARAHVVLGGVAVPVPAAAHAMLYLCIHGAEHVWFRLKWLQDIARIALAGPPGLIADCAALAARLRLTPVLAAALALVERVFAIPVPAAPPADRTAQRLIALSQAALVLPADVATNPPLGWLLRKLPMQMNLRGDWRYRRAFLHQLLLAPRSFDRQPWPRWARWGYQPLRPFLFLRSRRRIPD